MGNCRPKRVLLALEPLEARDCPAVYTWISDDSGSWDDPDNWHCSDPDPVASAIPNWGDSEVIFGVDGHNGDCDMAVEWRTLSTTLTEDYTGTLTVGTAYYTNLLQMEGGTIDTPMTSGVGDIFVGELNWLGGILNSTAALGTLIIEAQGKMTVELNDKITGMNVLLKDGATAELNINGDLRFNNNAGVKMEAGSQFHWNSQNAAIRSNGTGIINNVGGSFSRNVMMIGLSELPYQQSGETAILSVGRGTLAFTKALPTGYSVDINGGAVLLGNSVPLLLAPGTLETVQGFRLTAGDLYTAKSTTCVMKGDVTITGGTITVGNFGIGTLDVTGDFTMTGGTYKQNVLLTATSEEASRLNVTKKIDFGANGTATLSVNTLAPIPPNFRPNRIMQILSATMGIVGDFQTKMLNIMPGGPAYTTVVGQNIYDLKTPGEVEPE